MKDGIPILLIFRIRLPIKNPHPGGKMMPNSLELSGPAKTPSSEIAELAGSAPLACGLGRQRVVSQR
jgi:hypothetical protein